MEKDRLLLSAATEQSSFDLWVAGYCAPAPTHPFALLFLRSGILGGGSTLDRNQEYLLGVFLDKLPSCQRTRKTLVRKRCQRFRKAFPTIKVADTVLPNRTVFHRNGKPGFVHSSAFVARYKDAVRRR